MRSTAVIFILISICGAALRGQTRVVENWNSSWLFARQSRGTGALGSFDRENSVASQIEPRFETTPAPDYDDSSWQPVTLPHTWNAHDVMDQKPGYWRGIGWYRKHFRVDRKYLAKRIFLKFEGANEIAEFWLNGRKLGIHRGGYTGFEFDVTSGLRFGKEENVLTVKVDNLFHDTIPPTVKTDYSFYGGIYRNAWIEVRDPVYLSDAYWTTPRVTEAVGEITVNSEVTNRSGEDVKVEVVHELLDPQGRTVKTFSAQLVAPAGRSVRLVQQGGSIEHPQFWGPDTPNLYSVRTSLRRNAEPIDVTSIPLGFRWFRFDPQKGFFLNGKRVQIQGTNWHQSYPGMGNAVPDSRHRKDMEVIHDMGANFWRTSHYPHAVATLDASDRLGLMVWDELPINKEIGDPRAYTDSVLDMAREMITRDRNHPSVILWGIAGEVNAPKSVSMHVVGATAGLYRELDPSRPVVMHAPRGDELETLVDVTGLGVDKETDEKHLQHPNRIYMTGEYSASLSGRGIYGQQPGSDEEAAIKHEAYLSKLNQRPWMAGGCIWHQFDYDGESYDAITPHVVAFGMNDIWRIPKEPYYFYQSQWSARPMVHIVGHWTWPGEEGQTRTVRVYSNAGEVELFLNGQSLGRQGTVDDPGLKHPAHIWKVPYRPGTLRAVAHFAGREVSDERKTAGVPYQILLSADADQLRSGDPESLTYITATVVDRNGVIVPDAVNPISFTLYGPGDLLEQTWPPYGTGLTWNTVAGMTRIAFRATARSGRAVVSASSAGLSMGRLEIQVTAPNKPDEMSYKELFGEDEPVLPPSVLGTVRPTPR